MDILPQAELEAALLELPGWVYDRGAIRKTFTFAGFAGAAAFVARLVPAAESADHHPDLRVGDRHVEVSFTTHSVGGVTLRDVAGARDAERQAGEA